jgi:hypothetical protein
VVADGPGRVHARLGANVMLITWMKHAAAFAAVASAMVLGTAVEPAAAATTILDPGVACDFGLRLDAGDDTRSVHEFKDANGNVVRLLLAGRGTAVTLTNEDTGASLSLSANGAPWNIVNHPDGTSTYTTMGHLVLILFPTDIPAGPSTTLYVGRVVFDVNNTTGVFTLKQTRGTATDLCAALSG